jgi:D-alanyl-D-alanine carboxypeptidase
MKTTTIIFVSFLLTCLSCNSRTGEQDLETSIKNQFVKQASKKHNINESIFLVHSDSRNIHLKFAHTNHPEGEVPVDKFFHTASIGKTFTSVLVAILYEEGLLDYNDRISLYLGQEILEGLFVIDGVDHASEVMVHHLLNHTSGVADFYTDKPD